MKRDLDLVIVNRPSFAALATPPVAACLFAVCAIVALHWSTAASIVAIWLRSETFAHGFIVIPICLWLAWRKRAELAATPAKPWWPGLVVVVGGSAIWLVASAAVRNPRA